MAGMVQYLHANGMLDEAFIRERFIGFYSDTFLEDVKQGEACEQRVLRLRQGGCAGG